MIIANPDARATPSSAEFSEEMRNPDPRAARLRAPRRRPYARRPTPDAPVQLPSEPKADMAARPSIYWTGAGRRAVHDWYIDRVARFPVPVASRWARTRLGQIHALEAGPTDARPLVVLHGHDLNAAAMADLIAPLSAARRVVAIDSPGEPGLSAEVRPPRGGPGPSAWLDEALDSFEVPGPADLVGLSLGGWQILKLAASRPDRVARLALIGPGGLAWIRLSGQLRMAAGLVRYAVAPGPRSLDWAVGPLYGPGIRPDPDVAALLGLAFRHVIPDPSLAVLAPRRAAEFRGLRAPSLVFCGEHDVFFDHRRLLDRARRVLPGSVAAEVLEGEGHMPSTASLAEVARRIVAVFDASPEPASG